MLNVEVRSSDGIKCYTVQFDGSGSRWAVYCTCPAATRNACRHRRGLLLRDWSLLANGDDQDAVEDVLKAMDASGWRSKALAYEEALEAIENQQQALVKRQRLLKVEHAEFLRGRVQLERSLLPTAGLAF